jgi:hypothetical protein
MSTRLPVPGSDDGIWGDLLNTYLSVEHTTSGTLKIRTDGTLSPANIGALSKNNNLNDLGNTALSRSNLGLKMAATLDIGTATGTVAAGDDSRFSNYRGAWKQATAYNINDVVQHNGASFRCTAGHNSYTTTWGDDIAFQNDFKIGYWVQLGGRQQWFDVRDFGACIDGSTNDTAAIQGALNAAGASSGGVVYIPAGVTLVTTLVLPNQTSLTGAGMWATTVRLLSNTNGPAIKNYVSPDGVQANGEFTSIRDLKIDGHVAGTNGGSGNTSSNAHGIYFTTNPLNGMATHDSKFDPHHLVENVYIINCAGWGFYQTGRGESRLINVYVESCVQGGFSPTYDTFLTSCSAGANGGPGFSFTHGDITAVNCKSFLSGAISASITVGSGPSNQPGYYISGTAISCTMSGCIAQNNNGQGFLLNNLSGAIMSGCCADSNNYGLSNSNTAFAGIELNNTSNCILDFTATQGYQSGVQIGNQYNALRLTNNSNNNDIRVVTSAPPQYTLGPVYSSDSALLANRIVANGAALNPAYTLAGSGDVTISSPADGQALVYNASNGKWINSTAGSGNFTAGILGDGSDGATTLDGITTVPWATLSGGVYTMSRDCLTTALTIAAGVTLFCAGYRIFCQGTIRNNGTISANGNNATSSTGAAASISRSLAAGSKGGNGSVAAGSTANNATGGIAVGVGGSGGSGSGGSGGLGGTTLTTQTWPVRSVQGFIAGSVAYGGSVNALGGGSGGGGGGGDGTNTGGGGGAGGSIICILARTCINSSSGTLTATGGNGFNPTSGNTGGGAGGGGGLIIVFSINPWSQNGTTSASGGAGGSGHGTGISGTNGSAGTILNIQLQ